MSGNVLIPTTAADVRPRSREQDVATLNQDIIRSFDVQNSNPFDAQELQSLSNFDALRSVLAPDHMHDFSLLDKGGVPPGEEPPAYSSVVEHAPASGSAVFSTIVSTGHPTPPADPIYATVSKEPAEPIYATVNKAPTVIKSKKLGATASIEISNGPSIHKSYTAVSTPDTFSASSALPPPPPPPPAAAPAASCSPFPKIPEEIVARAMQRLEHNQEKCFEFLKTVLETMTEHDCSAEMAESIALLDFPEKKKANSIVLIKQFSELGFPTEDIIEGLKQEPKDRDALLDYLTR